MGAAPGRAPGWRRMHVLKACGCLPAAMAPLVHDARQLLACLVRMREGNDAVVFWNASREFRLMLRNDPDVDDDELAFDLCIVPEDDDSDDECDSGGLVRRVLELEHDGYEEDGLFVVDSQSFQLDDLKRRPSLLDDSVERINAVYNYCVCPCGAYLIKDGAKQCLYCQLTQDETQDATPHTCPICLESGSVRHMARQPCCKQLLHSRCLTAWMSTGRHVRCPMCRA